MVPIVEPEILSKGEHDINRTLQVHEEMLSILFRVLNKHHVYLEGMVLKPAMVLPGTKNGIKCTPQVSFNNTRDGSISFSLSKNIVIFTFAQKVYRDYLIAKIFHISHTHTHISSSR